MSKRPRITAHLPQPPASPAGSVYARTEIPPSEETMQDRQDVAAADPAAKGRKERTTKRQIYVLDVDQVAWVKRLALALFEASDGCDPGQSAIVRAILRGVMESGVDLPKEASTPEEVRGLIRARMAGGG